MDRLSSQQPDGQTGKDPDNPRPKQNLQSQSPSPHASRDSHYQTNKIMLLDYMEDIASSLPSSEYRSSRQLISLDNTTSDGISNNNEVKMEEDVLVDKYLAGKLRFFSRYNSSRMVFEQICVYCRALFGSAPL